MPHLIPIVGIFMYQLLMDSIFGQSEFPWSYHLAGTPSAVRHFSSQQCSTTCAELRLDGWRVPGLRRQWLPLHVSGVFFLGRKRGEFKGIPLMHRYFFPEIRWFMMVFWFHTPCIWKRDGKVTPTHNTGTEPRKLPSTADMTWN